MSWKLLVTSVVLAPFVALLGGVGFLFYQIGQTWDARSTDSLIAGLVATCGGGAVIIGVLLAVIIGIPFAIRMFGEAGYSARKGWGELKPSSPYSARSYSFGRKPEWLEQPPMLEDKQQGSWRTLGPNYDLWENERPDMDSSFDRTSSEI